MIVSINSSLKIMWGDVASCPFSDGDFAFFAFTENLKKNLGLNSLWLLNQEHTNQGMVAYDSGRTHCFARIGDYLITNQRHVGIVVTTADCLPMVFFDPQSKAIAAIHAGWKGTVQGIATRAVRDMQHHFAAQPRQLQIWFGPHARTCCYEVQPLFLENLAPELREQAVVARDGRLYFDSALYNELLLGRLGIVPDQINHTYQDCTMCASGYHSRRKEGPGYIAQLNVAWLS